MAIGTADIIAPVLTATEVVPLFLAGMTAQTGLSRLFRRLILERNDLGDVAFGDVIFPRTMTGLTAGDFVLPAADLGKLSVGSMRVGFELVFMTVLACVTTDVARLISPGDYGRRLRLGFVRTNGLGTSGRGKPHDHAQH